MNFVKQSFPLWDTFINKIPRTVLPLFQYPIRSYSVIIMILSLFSPVDIGIQTQFFSQLHPNL